MCGGGCGPNEGIDDERERFWNDLNMIVERIGNGYRLYRLEDLNGWIGDRLRAGIIGPLEFQKRMSIKEKGWVYLLKGACLWVIRTLSTGICIGRHGWQGLKTEWR